jgi:uncharacterized Zn finger protein (UPF0148 family)
MKKLTCEMCGSTNFLKADGVFVCKSCNAKYSVEEAKKMMNEDSEIARPTQQKVVAENSAKLDNLYKAAHRAKEEDNIAQAFKYYEQIILENSDSWEANFYMAYFSAQITLEENNEASVQVVGNTVKLAGKFHDGIGPAIKSVSNCIDSVFDLIEAIKDFEEQKKAVETVSSVVKSFCQSLYSIITHEYNRTLSEIRDLIGQVDIRRLCEQSVRTLEDYHQRVSDMLAKIEERKTILENAVGKRRFEEFWAENQALKTELESEKATLIGQIEAHNKEILAIPEKTEGYNKMLELQKKVEKLTTEKKALGLFKLKEKKAVQEQIDSTKNEIASIQSRIDSAIEEVQKRIILLQSRIEAIDTELTKPR